LVFEGSRAEAEAWVHAQPRFEPSTDIPNVIIAAGVVALAAALSLAWSGGPRRAALVVVGAAVGLIPGAVLRLLVESGVIGETTLDMGANSNSIALFGAHVGGAIAGVLNARSARSKLPPPPVPSPETPPTVTRTGS
jgi:hypothetical protein